MVAAALRAEEAGVLKTWRHFEERSAGFFALGRTMGSGEPCAVLTTSGTAAAELLPAVVEAHYQGRPLVAVTADRPARFRGTGAPQAIVQPGIFGGYAEEGLEGWSGRGPVHWNVEVEEGDSGGGGQEAGGGDGQFVSFREDRESFDVGPLVSFLSEGIHRGLVVMAGGLRPEEREEAWHFLRRLKAPVAADAASGLREALGGLALADADRVLRGNPPGKVLRLGEAPVGRFWRDLEELPGTEVFSVCRTGYPGLARESAVVRGCVGRVLRGTGEAEEVGDALDLLAGNGGRKARAGELMEAFPASEPALVRTLSVFASAGSGVFLGNSLPVRTWNEFAQREVPVEARACRGANGIDGQVSAWLGASAGEEGAWGVFGDLTACYDLAGPAMLGQVEERGRVLAVVNNGGGRIFEGLPALRGLSGREMEVVTNAHGRSFGAWAEMWGMDYLRVTGQEDFDALEPGERTLLLEVAPDKGETEGFREAWEG